ncbi:MAG TPA: bifunctional (p)ppGpp synthetase/guanosine-3',5'-bis(diphosphate) 3'-pyrophosphohydrolase [Vicinamibacterales bacterium]|jgi:GTP pyrophosphokinase|nr:bifunctional (p)ppGpp synthetase/guanosine-3',5'-bis(diphosphate) 3'-pyrophosphohydrolase [Vicinamibacterales bacterium]
MIRFETLLEKVRSYTPEADLELLRRAYVFSALEHKGQVRHSGEPYLVHPLEVADFLADMKLDVVAVSAGLLHDVVEDTLTTPERINELFGPEIAHVVEGVTKIGAIPFSSSEERQAENFRKMLLAMVDDIRVILVKLADRLHNMRTLGHLPEERRIKIAQETLDIYAPIANRLGMSKVKNELEELSFKYLEPKAYEGLRARVEAKRRMAEAAIDELGATLRHKLEEAQVPITRVDGRIKRLYSIHLKLKKQKVDLERVYDFVALRVITNSVKDCYAALGIIHQTWSPVPGRIKDFIAMPRPNGYQSLHTSVISEHGFPFEVQIRTEEMHVRAEEGIAAHWKYKEGRVGDQRDERYFQWMRQLLEVQQEVRDPQEFLQNLKIDLYPEEVYIFTPKGEVRSLPRGATAIDFAYSIHTDVGNQCVGARINGKMVPLRTRLQNGDIVEIVTQAGHKPSRDWLAFVSTSRARSKIKHVLQGEERNRSVELGKRLFEKEARRFGLSPQALLDSPELAKFASEYGARSGEDLLAHIGYGKLSARTVLQKAVPPAQLKEKAPDSAVVSVVKRVLRPGGVSDKIKVRGTDDIMVFRAKCCNPIRGEKIVGYITRGKGVSVHAASCPNVLNLMFDPERRIDVEWDTDVDPGFHTVRLTMQVEDRKGMLAEISARVSDINTNITNMEARTGDDQEARIDMTVEIRDVKHLEKVIKSIKGVAGVLGVERTARV